MVGEVNPHPRVGVVVIGRNLGEDLRRCLGSLEGQTVVYVDSGSTDGSPECAEDLGSEIVRLDPGLPFTAARGRNAGFERLLGRHPGISYVQFVDGDCELEAGWIGAGVQYLDAHPGAAVVCGFRRERFPSASVYNRLMDMEWRGAVGSVDACGGDATIRATAFQEVGGYDASLIAGEEPELCLRLRRAGHQIVRLDHPMTIHDANVHRYSEWWRRQVRAGHAYSESAWMHGRSPDRFRVRELASAVVWGAALPVLIVGLVLMGHPGPAVLGLGAYPVQALRVASRREEGGRPALLYGVACMISKFAVLRGAALFLMNKLRGRRSRLIEYKAADRDLSRRKEDPAG